MKSLFINLSTSPSVTNLSTDYSGKYELVYNFQGSVNRILASSLNAWWFNAPNCNIEKDLLSGI